MQTNDFPKEQIVEHIVKWLKFYALEARCQGFVVGVSGGVDSALTSSLCAMTGLPTTCVQLPIHQHPDQLNRATEHIAQLKKRFPNVREEWVNLSDSFDALSRDLPQLQSDLVELALANTRARLRMSSLYFIAQCERALVAGTGNKVEDFGVGFYTKYGDGGVDVSPIADLTKTEVFALAAWAGVPSSILHAAPTDGLWGDNRGDEDQLGASYPELEWAMHRHEQGLGMEELEGREKEVMTIYLRLNAANQHKMVPIPVCAIPSEWKLGISERIGSQ